MKPDCRSPWTRRVYYTLSESWYDQHIDDWILWLPTTKGFFSPVNIKKAHAYGVEMQADLAVASTKDLKFGLNTIFSWAPSINESKLITRADQYRAHGRAA